MYIIIREAKKNGKNQDSPWNKPEKQIIPKKKSIVLTLPG
jgi:hypothetical protein